MGCVRHARHSRCALAERFKREAKIKRKQKDEKLQTENVENETHIRSNDHIRWSNFRAVCLIKPFETIEKLFWLCVAFKSWDCCVIGDALFNRRNSCEFWKHLKHFCQQTPWAGSNSSYWNTHNMRNSFIQWALCSFTNSCVRAFRRNFSFDWNKRWHFVTTSDGYPTMLGQNDATYLKIEKKWGKLMFCRKEIDARISFSVFLYFFHRSVTLRCVARRIDFFSSFFERWLCRCRNWQLREVVLRQLGWAWIEVNSSTIQVPSTCGRIHSNSSGNASPWQLPRRTIISARPNDWIRNR